MTAGDEVLARWVHFRVPVPYYQRKARAGGKTDLPRSFSDSMVRLEICPCDTRSPMLILLARTGANFIFVSQFFNCTLLGRGIYLRGD